MPTFRVLSVDARTSGGDRAALAELINDTDADAVCVHHAPHLGRWRQKVAVLARRSGRVVVAADGRSAGGNVLLSTLGVDAVTTTAARFAGDSRVSPPGAALAELRVGGREVLLVAATLVGNAAVRLGQARELQQAVERAVPGAPPAIVSAFGTDRPGTAAWQSLAGGRVAVGGRFFVDEGVDVGEAKQLGPGSSVRPPAVLAVFSV